MKLSDKIKFRLMDYTRKNMSDLIIPNFYINSDYEMDLFKMTKSGIVTEYEIKISRSDYFQDFKKRNKHELLKQGQRISNYFYFVFPEGLIKIDEIPDYCGALEYIEEYNTFRGLNSAKKLHRNHFTNYEMLCQKLVGRCNTLQSKYTWERHRNNENNRLFKQIIQENNIELPLLF